MKPQSVRFLASFLLAAPIAAFAQSPGDLDSRAPFYELPDVASLAEGGVRDVILRYRTDRRTLERFFDAPLSTKRLARRREVAAAWLEALDGLPFDEMGTTDQVDYLLFASELRHELRLFDLAETDWAETLPLLPFAVPLSELQEKRRSFARLEPAQAAELLVQLEDQLGELRKRLRAEEADEEDEEDGATEPLIVSRIVAKRAAGETDELREMLSDWYSYSAGYDPLFTWWMKEPFESFEEALKDYAKFLREKIAGLEEDDTDAILGDPIGREALLVELESEWIPYTPEELIEIAQSEFEWCDREMLLASQELGYGEDWRAAQQYVKTKFVEPGGQPEMIRMLAFEAVDFLEEKELLTIPALAKNSWRMQMMSPERQKYTPYFTGGEVISVSYPTEGMAHEDKLMSMRGNNLHFSRATVHHELIPGHHLQQFMNARNKPYRRMFGTPFWGEGWALYWEMLLWDEGFPKSAEDRVGMLFWRKHRCARILFSLNFQLGEWTPEECIDFLVERVGHERRNATAEVRRSVQGGYGALYQAAYMLGGLQFRALHRELVQSGQMTNRDLHDAILRENSIPVELVRAIVTNQPLERATRTTWRFYHE